MFNSAVNSKTILLIVCFMVLSAFSPANVYGYGYGVKGKDTLAAVHNSIDEFIKTNDFEGIKQELKRIEVPITNYYNYYGIDLNENFNEALENKDVVKLQESIDQLIFFAIREKIYWNTKEELKKVIAAKGRLRVMFQYYKILNNGIKEYDAANNSNYSRELFGVISGMKDTLGSAGTFGYKPEPPNLDEFIRLSSKFVETLVVIFPHFKEGFDAVINPH